MIKICVIHCILYSVHYFYLFNFLKNKSVND